MFMLIFLLSAERLAWFEGFLYGSQIYVFHLSDV